MACEVCNAKFSLFTRKKQCMDCKGYFCSECVIKRLGKILSCDSCSVLSQRPLVRSLIVQLRNKDLLRYLLAKKVPIKGCIEKEDLIRLLITFANGTDDRRDTEDTENIGSSPTNRPITENWEHNTEISNPVKLSDINTLSDLECLSVKQIKMLLSVNRVDFKGCREKCELLNRATMLWKEYKQSRTETEVPDENLCKICWDEPIECVILECGHMACCLSCGKQMSECPICKQYVVRVVRFFKA